MLIWFFVIKTRKKLTEVEGLKIIGDIQGKKKMYLVDDMVDTAGTITKAADIMISEGALSVRAGCFACCIV